MKQPPYKLEYFEPNPYIYDFIDKALKTAESYPQTAVVVKLHDRGVAVNVVDRNDIPCGWKVVVR